jgi:hypothetical protein
MHSLYPIAAAVAAWIFGAAWYGALGKHYQRALGKNPGASAGAGAANQDSCKGRKMLLAPLALCFLAELVMAAALSYVLARMSVVGWHWGAVVGAMIGVGVLLPAVIVTHLFPGRSRSLMAIDGLHWVGVAVIEGAVLGAFA